jgi:hypothetical protein
MKNKKQLAPASIGNLARGRLRSTGRKGSRVRFGERFGLADRGADADLVVHERLLVEHRDEALAVSGLLDGVGELLVRCVS